MTKSLNNYKSIMVVVVSLVLGVFSNVSQAISLSTFRIYLDTDKPAASFIMFNKEIKSESCQVGLVHNNFDEVGKMFPVEEGDPLPANSAEPWIRYSPRSFIAEARAPQTVRFTLRRKANSEPAEYRSYLRVDCEELEDEKSTEGSSSGSNSAKVAIKPKLVQQIPIIVRTGRLKADLAFDNINLKDGILSFDLVRSGNRSVYGLVELVNKETDNVVRFKKNVSVYTETTRKPVSFSIGSLSLDNLALRFSEEEAYGGSLVVEQSLVDR